jgi:hypothetical protein
MIIVSFVILLFLWHFPSAIIPIVTISIAVLLSFIPMYGMKLTANIMSLSGIAISIGVLVDGHGRGHDETYRRPDDWRHSDELHSRTARLSAALRDLEMSLRIEEGQGPPRAGGNPGARESTAGTFLMVMPGTGAVGKRWQCLRTRRKTRT